MFIADLISLNSAQISSVQGGWVSRPSSPTMFSIALLFFMPTLAGSFILADLTMVEMLVIIDYVWIIINVLHLQLTPLVFTSAHLMPVLVSVGTLS